MKARPLVKDPERALQERFSLPAWLVFHALALWSAASYWLQFKRVCAWHEPKPRYMGGNPIARKVTHGICPQCFARVSGEIVSQEDLIAECRPVVSHPFSITVPSTPKTYVQE